MRRNGCTRVGRYKRGKDYWKQLREECGQRKFIAASDLASHKESFLDDDVCLELYYTEDVSGVDFIGFRMKKGIILIHGSVGKYLGKKMSGGLVVVEGIAGEGCGEGMTEGALIVLGEIKEPMGDRKGGKVFRSWEEWLKNKKEKDDLEGGDHG